MLCVLQVRFHSMDRITELLEQLRAALLKGLRMRFEKHERASFLEHRSGTLKHVELRALHIDFDEVWRGNLLLLDQCIQSADTDLHLGSAGGQCLERAACEPAHARV